MEDVIEEKNKMIFFQILLEVTLTLSTVVLEESRAQGPLGLISRLRVK